ncbi:hypothetical protein QBC46DRAFT_392679 [Diplogelasinospora grovesii]|uniref:Uncharacterized protein n=1 Tax=Diplogelasinospora grovesii TaxID=303347 RepID=A0AAN6S2H9_9PEZI|nr:hypothetical protein QBC46DRAFT_392679 [Diplogelasinospora grovesii]
MDGLSRRPPVHRFSLQYLVIIPVLLAVATGLSLFLHSDTNVPMLYSQCHARSRISWLSHIPVIGAPSCFLVSFFQEALASARSFAVMSVILSFVGALLTVSTVEAARICNGPNVLIAYPTGAWLVFNLLGGAIVWEVVIIPAFFHRSREIITARKQGPVAGVQGRATDPTFGEAMRHIGRVAEVVAIPTAVALGYVLPSVLMLVLDKPVPILIWLFFPVWVSLLRQAVREIILVLLRDDESWWHTSIHLESNRLALAAMYAVPIVCSVLSHGLLIWSLLAQADDRKEMTRATLKFIVIDVFYIGLTVLYWIFVEAGCKVALITLGAGVVLGPGAGLCIGFICRENTINPHQSVTVVAVGSRRSSGGLEQGSPPSEESPLLR